MTSPYIPWPGTDGNLTGNMWAWWFGARPQYLGPVPLVEAPAYDEEVICGPGEVWPDCGAQVEGLGGVQPREVSILGAALDEKPTPPPCSAGYIPIIDRGVLKCTPGYMPSSMVNMTPQPRTFPVTAYYGWKQV